MQNVIGKPITYEIHIAECELLINSDDDRLEVIKTLLLDEEAIGEAAVFMVTVLQSKIEYGKTDFGNLSDFQSAVIAKLKQKMPFSPRQRTSLNEGFLEFSEKGNQVDFYFVREVARRWEYVNAQKLRIESVNLKRVDSAYRVRINLSFEPNKVTATLFGGTDSLVIRARETVCSPIKELVNNFNKKDTHFTPEQMQNMLEKFGKHVTLINIDPRDNEKFSKIIEKHEIGKPEVSRVIVYDVMNFRMSGIQIINSPEVRRLIKEQNIHLTEISGSIFIELGFRVTCRVKLNGRVEFIIPTKQFGNDPAIIYESAVKLYSRLVPEKGEDEKGPLEKFL